MPSEAVAQQMLKDVMLGTDANGKAIVVTTFASHLARLSSIITFGKKLGRKIVFLGRSMDKYVTAGEQVGIVDFRKSVEIVQFGSQIKKRLKQIMKDGKEKYLLVVTGHQGEPKATLAKMVNKELCFQFDPGDHIIFSFTLIPTPINQEHRKVLEDKLKSFKVRIFRDIHVSGHAAREDIRDLFLLLKPKHIIPAHGTSELTSAVSDLAHELGYDTDKNVHLLHNGQCLMFE